MKAVLVSLMLAAGMATASAQGTPAPAGQTVSPEAAASAEKAVDKRHAKRLAKKKARADAKAAKAASAP